MWKGLWVVRKLEWSLVIIFPWKKNQIDNKFDTNSLLNISLRGFNYKLAKPGCNQPLNDQRPGGAMDPAISEFDEEQNKKKTELLVKPKPEEIDSWNVHKTPGARIKIY